MSQRKSQLSGVNGQWVEGRNQTGGPPSSPLHGRCQPLSLPPHNQRTANAPESPVFLHPVHHPWLEPLCGKGSVDDMGDFPTGTLQEADIIINADTSCRVLFHGRYALKVPPVRIKKGDTHIGL